MDGHFILCGLGRIGWRVLECLQATGTPVVVIDNRCRPSDPRLRGARLVLGDCRQEEILQQAGVASARGVLVLTSEDLINLSTALTAHQLNPTVRIVVRMFNQQLVARLKSIGVPLRALSASALTAPLLALVACTGEALGVIDVDGLPRHQVAEVSIRASSPLGGLTLAQVRERHAVQILAHVPRGEPCRFLQGLEEQARLASGDRLVVCGEPNQIQQLRHSPQDLFAPDLHWAHTIRRFARVAWRTLGEIDLPVKIATAVLLVVILGSTLVFHFTMRNDEIPDALYRTISLMATGADMGGRELAHGGWQKVYVSLLRIVGAALTAAFTAILASYLVRAQLGGALEIRRIPERGHVVVCGLGNVGTRVVEALLEENERVVVLEKSASNPMISTMRRRGVAVIVANAASLEVLRQVHADEARAVVVATSDELVNLEVGLLVRELNPLQRVVVRMTDHRLVRALRESAGVRLAMSIPDMAAPAFVAALYGDHVRSVFFVEGRLLGVIDLHIHGAEGSLVNRPVRQVADEFNLHPVGLLDAKGQVLERPLEAILRPGYRLTAILELSDLQRLVQQERLLNAQPLASTQPAQSPG